MGIRVSTATPVKCEGKGCVVHDQEGKTVVGCLHSRRGGKKFNQDSAVIRKGDGAKDGLYSGVFDGHGKHGHLVSRLVKQRLVLLLLDQVKAIAETGVAINETSQETSIDDLSSSKRMFSDWETVYVNGFTEMDEEIKQVIRKDASFSGTTAVVVVKQGDDLVIANLGDSRAVLGKKAQNGVEAVQLTTDLKPGTPDEAARIRRSNGRVFALREEPELERAWLPRVCSPGMAMSRSFGDFVMKNHGIIAIPVVTHHRITPDDLFIVLATDGIWDVLSNEDVVSIVRAAETEEMAAKAVVDAAMVAWKFHVPHDRPDDCTAVCIFLQNEVEAQAATT